jgi:two-component system, response regulator PdtaR
MISARLVIAHEEASVELRPTLESFGHRVVGEAVDAAAARTLARQLRPDLVLLATAPGDEESFEVAEALGLELDLPVFFLSRAYDAILLERATAAGRVGFMVEPFTDVALHIALRMALDRHTERQSLRRDLEEVREKLEARKLINRAKAILMERHGLSEPEAFQRLQTQSMKTATPMKTLAEAIILSARVLGEETKRRRATA